MDAVKSAIALGAPVNATNESLWIQAGDGTREALRKEDQQGRRPGGSGYGKPHERCTPNQNFVFFVWEFPGIFVGENLGKLGRKTM